MLDKTAYCTRIIIIGESFLSSVNIKMKEAGQERKEEIEKARFVKQGFDSTHVLSSTMRSHVKMRSDSVA